MVFSTFLLKKKSGAKENATKNILVAIPLFR